MRKITVNIILLSTLLIASNKSDTLLITTDKTGKNIQTDGYLIEWSPKKSVHKNNFITQISLSRKKINGYLILKDNPSGTIKKITLKNNNTEHTFLPQNSKYNFASVKNKNDIIWEWSLDCICQKNNTIILTLEYSDNNSQTKNIVYKIRYTPSQNFLFYAICAIIILLIFLKFFITKKTNKN